MKQLAIKYPTQLEIVKNFFFTSNISPCYFHMKDGVVFRATITDCHTNDMNNPMPTISSITKWEVQQSNDSKPFWISHDNIAFIEQPRNPSI